ncbi:MAG TPA: hypothetical protein PKY31_03110 [Spirochaetota bacterium]|nr:hypothetical protein [Spirochaetota bacterium]
MKRVSQCAAAAIVISLIISSLSCSKDNAGGPPRELLRTWSLYPDCPNNSITFRNDGTYEWVDCYTDGDGNEKKSRWTGSYSYAGDSDIRVIHQGGTTDTYRLETEGGKKVLRHGGFVFHPAR